ncbi:Glutamate receptor-like 43 [Homarus americanus]|uniref:Glutamate receptor-like 43 n=1 Tax=Homarus americanus TaxID=6706 RepID=A0A8J5J8M9_HOMAM|nr:Glutamate receptor-like 43 [Homarus americanus]
MDVVKVAGLTFYLVLGAHLLLLVTGAVAQSSAEKYRAWWQKEARLGSAEAARGGNILKFRFEKAPTLLVAAEEWLPYTKVTWYNDTFASVSGPSRKLLDVLSSTLNFKYRFVRGDGYFGALEKDGSWNGMLGMLHRQEVDMALGPIGVTYSRSKVANFTVPLGQEYFRIMTGRPRPLPDPWTIAAPFTWMVWICLLVSLLVMWMVSFMVAQLVIDFRGPRGLSDHLLTVFAVLVSQGVTWEPKGAAMRITCITWMFFSLIVTSYFKSSYTSLLTVKSLPATHDDLRDILNDHNLTFLLEDNTSFKAFVQESEQSIVKEISKELKRRGRFLKASELQEVLERDLPDRGHAALLEEHTIKKYMSINLSKTGRCNFYMSRSYSYSIYISMAVSKGSPLLDLFNARILSLREYGIYAQWVTEELRGASHCYLASNRVTEIAPYTLVDMKMSFVLLGGGTGLAALILLWDIITHWLLVRRPNKASKITRK